MMKMMKTNALARTLRPSFAYVMTLTLCEITHIETLVPRAPPVIQEPRRRENQKQWTDPIQIILAHILARVVYGQIRFSLPILIVTLLRGEVNALDFVGPLSAVRVAKMTQMAGRTLEPDANVRKSNNAA